MNKKDNKNNNHKKVNIKLGMEEFGEDGTKYGEFVPSYFTWVSLEDQKYIAKQLEDMTDEDKNEK